MYIPRSWEYEKVNRGQSGGDPARQCSDTLLANDDIQRCGPRFVWNNTVSESNVSIWRGASNWSDTCCYID